MEGGGVIIIGISSNRLIKGWTDVWHCPTCGELKISESANLELSWRSKRRNGFTPKRFSIIKWNRRPIRSNLTSWCLPPNSSTSKSTSPHKITRYPSFILFCNLKFIRFTPLFYDNLATNVNSETIKMVFLRPDTDWSGTSIPVRPLLGSL